MKWKTEQTLSFGKTITREINHKASKDLKNHANTSDKAYRAANRRGKNRKKARKRKKARLKALYCYAQHRYLVVRPV